MPELPDLQVFSRNLTKILKGKTLKKVSVPNAKKLNVSPADLSKALHGAKLVTVERAGKELHFIFDNERLLALHLMLHGKLYFFTAHNEQKYTVIELLFEDGIGLALTDFQSAATPTLDPEKNETPDALSKTFDFNYLKEKLASKRSPIKTVLLDQHIVRGIGNAYADEILWHARLSPFSLSNKIPDPNIRRLHKSIIEVLEDAEKQIIKTHPDIISGEVRDFLQIHHAGKAKTVTGATIHQKPISSRKTYYTDEQETFVKQQRL